MMGEIAIVCASVVACCWLVLRTFERIGQTAQVMAAALREQALLVKDATNRSDAVREELLAMEGRLVTLERAEQRRGMR